MPIKKEKECKKKERKRFNYHFDPQPMAFVLKWSSTFQLC